MVSIVPAQVTLYRIVHVDNLDTILNRGGLHAPNFTPRDGLPYRTIHDANVQASRHDRSIWCGPRGTCHDYIPFYFGPLSVMLLNLKTGRVQGYTEGQQPIVYLTTTIDRLISSKCRFVFSDGHGLASFTNWYDDLARLDQVDWDIVAARYWADKPEDNDRRRRKQAEFLVWRALDWSAIETIGVLNEPMQKTISAILGRYPNGRQPTVELRPQWYY